MIDFDDERNLVGVLARHEPERAERARDPVAAALQGKLDDVLRIEVRRVWRERRAGAVLDALVHRQDGEVTRAMQAPGVIEPGQAIDHAIIAV